MATLIFDIETVGEEWESLDAQTQKKLLLQSERSARNEDEKQQQLQNLKDDLSLSPLTGKIVAIGVYDLERKQGAVYYTGQAGVLDSEDGAYMLKQRTEKEMLEDFWEGARSYTIFVTYNGRAFDLPFILHRSVVNGVHPTQDLLEGRYLYQQKQALHVDLRDQLTFYGAMHKHSSLPMFCRAYGTESPDVDEITGKVVTELFVHKKFLHIAQHNARSLTATTALYERWLKYLAPPDFLNNIMDV